MVDTRKPDAVVLYVFIGMGPCLWPKYWNVTQMGTAALAFMKIALIFASTAKDITLFIFLYSVSMVPFSLGLGLCRDRSRYQTLRRNGDVDGN